MSVSGISGSFSSDYLIYSIQQKQKNITQSSAVSNIGAAAIFDLNSSSDGGISAASAVTQSSTSSASCPLGNATCSNCGGCSSTSKINANNQESTNMNYLVETAINSYEMNSVKL